MKPLLYASVFLVACGVSGCSSDDFDPEEDPIVIADLAGTWTCTQFLAVSTVDPQVQFELISLGGSLFVTVAPDGSFVGQASFPDPDTGIPIDVPFSGSFDLESQTLLFDGLRHRDCTVPRRRHVRVHSDWKHPDAAPGSLDVRFRFRRRRGPGDVRRDARAAVAPGRSA